MTMILQIFLTGLFFMPSTLGDCVEEAVRDGNYMTCALVFTSYLSDKLDPSDPSSATTVMCSKEGRQIIQCLVDYLQKCPQLMSTAEENPLLASTFQMVTDLDSACRMVSGPCSKLHECMAPMQEMAGESKRGDMGNMGQSLGPTPFNHLQQLVGQVCGPVRETYTCLEGYRDECPESIGMANDLLGNMSNTRSSNTLEMYIKRECQNVPSTFATDVCVKEKLMDPKFVDCCNEAFVQNPKTEEEICRSAMSVKECIDVFVGVCGKKQLQTLEKAAVVFVPGVPEKCAILDESKNQNGGTSSLCVTVAVLVCSSLITMLYNR